MNIESKINRVLDDFEWRERDLTGEKSRILNQYEAADAIKQLIREVLDEVKLERVPLGPSNNPEARAYYAGCNDAISEMEAKIKEIGL